MATQLDFEEKLGVFQIDPKQATLDDISIMATELQALKERDEHIKNKIINIIKSHALDFQDQKLFDVLIKKLEEIK